MRGPALVKKTVMSNSVVNAALEGARTTIAETVRGIVAGEDVRPVSPGWDESDPGLFAPDHAVRIVHADAAMLIGGVRSLLLQSLHPVAMYGVSTHSSFREDPLGRLQRTSSFLANTCFGTGSEAQQAIDIVKTVHERVQGTMPDGTPYSASDPHLLQWVHITEIASFLDAYQTWGAQTITNAQADEYVDGMATIGLALGMTSAPRTVAELHACIESYRPELAVTEWSEEAVRFLLWPPLPATAKPAYGIIFAAALMSLPGWARSMVQVPLPPGINKFAIQPAAVAMTRTLQWASFAQRDIAEGAASA